VQLAWLGRSDPPVNGFVLVAAIGAILRQFCVASRLGLAAIRAGGLPAAWSEVRCEHARFKRS
jgi:hypothetical protein